MFATKPPQIIKPVVTSKGVHLISVEEIVKPQLNEELRLEILADLFGSWVKQKLQDVKIVMKLDTDIDNKLSPEQRRFA